MPAIPKKLYAGTPSTATTTLYTAPAGNKTIVKNIVIGNTTGADATITLNFAGVGLINNLALTKNETVTFDLSLVLESSETITGIQGTSSALRLHISGVEVS
jgi:hypothetical protein